MKRIIELQNPWWQKPNWRITATPRILMDKVVSWLDKEEAIVITGPRRAGKTYLLYQVIEYLLEERVPPDRILYLSLDHLDLRRWLKESPTEFVHYLEGLVTDERVFVFLDEFQKAPELAEITKLFHDSFGRIKFFLSGSSSMAIARKVSESLLGRTMTFVMTPFTFSEYLRAKIEDHNNFQVALAELQHYAGQIVSSPSHESFVAIQRWFGVHRLLATRMAEEIAKYMLTGGYPRISHEPPTIAFQLLNEIKTAYIEKDILSDFSISNIDAFQKTIEIIGHTLGAIVNQSSLALDAGVTLPVLRRFLNILRHTYIIDPLLPYCTNKISSIKKSQKLLFWDLGFRNQATRAFDSELLARDLGRVAENFIFLQLRNYLRYELNDFGRLFFWRSKDGNEIDFILDYRGRLVPIESKQTAKINRGMTVFMEKLKMAAGIIVTAKELRHEQRGSNNIYYLPWWAFGALI